MVPTSTAQSNLRKAGSTDTPTLVNYQFPQCTCSCCTSGIHLAATDQKMRCFPLLNECTSQCESRDSIISSALGTIHGFHLIDYKRFCYLECKPQCGAPRGSKCNPLAPYEVEKGKTPDGNGKPVNGDCSDANSAKQDKMEQGIDELEMFTPPEGWVNQGRRPTYKITER